MGNVEEEEDMAGLVMRRQRVENCLKIEHNGLRFADEEKQKLVCLLWGLATHSVSHLSDSSDHVMLIEGTEHLVIEVSL